MEFCLFIMGFCCFWLVFFVFWISFDVSKILYEVKGLRRDLNLILNQDNNSSDRIAPFEK